MCDPSMESHNSALDGRKPPPSSVRFCTIVGDPILTPNADLASGSGTSGICSLRRSRNDAECELDSIATDSPTYGAKDLSTSAPISVKARIKIGNSDRALIIASSRQLDEMSAPLLAWRVSRQIQRRTPGNMYWKLFRNLQSGPRFPSYWPLVHPLVRRRTRPA